MVSSELVVLLIVCVGINTGSAQEYCQDGPFADRTCQYNSAYDINTDCMDTTLECVTDWCDADINSFLRPCYFNKYSGQTVNIPIRCCFCDNSTTNEIWWDCDNTTSSVSPTPSLTPTVVLMSEVTSHKTIPTRYSVTITLQSSTMITTPIVNMTTDAINSVAIAVPVVVVVLVVCLLVVCAIATIIILYQRAKRHHDHQQDTTNDYDQTLHQLDNTLYTTSAPQDNGLYNHTHHGHTAPPPIYSTLAEEGAPADYSTIVDKEAPGNEYSEIQQPASDTSNEGLVYSAVVVKDGKKTTVKTMATTQNEQTSSTSDTVQPAEGMVYSAVIRQDGKKTSVKVTVE